MKLQSLLLLGILIFGSTIVNAQSDNNAKNLYFGFKPKPRKEKEKQRRNTTTTTTTTTATTTATTKTERTTTTVSTNRTNSGNSSSGNRNRRNNQPATGNNSTGVSPSETGLPGTKVTIELLRKGKLSFVKPSFTFRSGDKIRIRLKTNFEGYVSVLNLGSSGRINLLYPVQGRDNYVVPTEDYQIPQGNGWIVFDDIPGTETVSIIMSEDELTSLNSLDNNSDYFRKDRTSKDLFVQTSGNDVYAVFRQQNVGENFGFTLKLKHKK